MVKIISGGLKKRNPAKTVTEKAEQKIIGGR